MAFFHTMLEERGASTSGKGKEPVKKPTGEAERPGECIREDG